jgi:glycosyltransferase involved in cell wall biosynthesis
MHLVSIASAANAGGAEISLLELLRRLNPQIKVSVILPKDGTFHAMCKSAGLDVHNLHWPEVLTRIGEGSMRSSLARLSTATEVMRGIRSLRDQLREMGADVVLTNGLKAHMFGALACRSEYVLLWYLRESMERRANSRRILKTLSRFCNGGIAISDYVKNSWQNVIRNKPVTVIYNIVDVPSFDHAADPSDMTKKTEEVWFSVIGALTPIKGQDVFIKAASLARLPDARYLIVGTNFYESESQQFELNLRQQVEELGLTGQVRFLGFRNDIPSLLKFTDVVVQPNRGPEGLGRGVLESMVAGVPVIAVNQWGPAEILKQSGSGLLFGVGDAEALACHMRRLAADPGLRSRLGNDGRAWTARHLVPEELVQRFEQFVEFVSHESVASG